jgi:hypothetical protein
MTAPTTTIPTGTLVQLRRAVDDTPAEAVGRVENRDTGTDRYVVLFPIQELASAPDYDGGACVLGIPRDALLVLPAAHLPGEQPE